ncbi:MAG TPA: RNA polymerase subunit sigma-70 [Kofleriaceae bacterium]|nr:RNA polymerase subunit sigma-70 [Kofleriaceae bacterium]
MSADREAFDRAVAAHRAELHAHCYRMLGSVHDADDAVQDALLAAWRGFAGFTGRGTVRAWLYQIATRACLRVLEQRPRRRLIADEPASDPRAPVAAMHREPVWLEPYPDDPAAQLAQREAVELAFVAALQHLPANQRAALLVTDVLGFAASEAAALLETSVASLNSALQRARKALADRTPAHSQQAELGALGDAGQRALVAAFIAAWQRADVDGLLALLARDVKFSMPPIPSWYDGRDAVAAFFAAQVFATPWRLIATRASGQLAFACYQGPALALGALNVIGLRGGEIVEMTGFLDPATHARLGIERILPGAR